MRPRIVGLGFLLSALLWSTPARAALITFESIAKSSTELWVDVSIVGVKDLLIPETDLYGFSFDVSFLSSAFVGVPILEITEGDFLNRPDVPGDAPKPTIAPFFVGDVSLGSGTVFSSLLTQVPGATQDGLLARLIFSGVRLTDPGVLVSEANLARFVPDSPDPVFVRVETTEITPVPEPSTLALLGLGLAAMARHRLKRQTLE